MSQNNETYNPGESSSDYEMDDLNCLNFPSDVDWSSTVVLRCDPGGGPYGLTDVVSALHTVVLRKEVFNLGPTALNHVFVMSFKTAFGLENFFKYMKRSRTPNGLRVKGHPCTLTRVPSNCVSVHVRWIPLEIDTAHLVEILSDYGTIVKTEWIKNNFQGWFHVYTNERKFTINLKPEFVAEDLPYGIVVKGLFGAVSVEERNPKCLECYFSGHKGDACIYKECPLYRP